MEEHEEALAEGIRVGEGGLLGVKDCQGGEKAQVGGGGTWGPGAEGCSKCVRGGRVGKGPTHGFMKEAEVVMGYLQGGMGGGGRCRGKGYRLERGQGLGLGVGERGLVGAVDKVWGGRGNVGSLLDG